MEMIGRAASMYEAHGQMPSSLELAYLGDAVYSLYVRMILVPGGGKIQKTHLATSAIVCAHAQSEALLRIEGMLTEEEADVARRARNCSQKPPHHCDPAEYRRATAVEALLGYLCIKKEFDRADAIMKAILAPHHETEETENA